MKGFEDLRILVYTNLKIWGYYEGQHGGHYGGAMRGGQFAGQWPGLSEANLYDRRDIMPTADIRATAAWVMHGLFGTDKTTLETTVFPGLQIGENPGLLL